MLETILIIVLIIVVGVIGLSAITSVERKYLQEQIDDLKKENRDLRMRMISVEGKTNIHDIQINGVRFKSDINDINLKYVSKLLGK